MVYLCMHVDYISVVVQNNQHQYTQRGVILQHVPLANEAFQACYMVCLLFVCTLHSSSSASCIQCNHRDPVFWSHLCQGQGEELIYACLRPLVL